ncbi:MAG: DUF1292 domain-containing protein [Alicyclobacillus herbarius]|uniref:DUF1292 domain-containing protein n=1 Tax=Alicyclobacillus herbarius TaxID=122960 RepID=UPI0004183091|nr:DUF1292 domain-containing protein [Alicyclobacillus herbarius]MCL6631724.1 DUF1292 domain-containing protein [Alicyclobacillus herbarius]
MSEQNHDHLHDHEHDHDHETEEVIVLQDEDGNEHNFLLTDFISVDDKDYAVLLPADEDDDEGVIMRLEGEDGDDVVLAIIEDEEEWQKVVDAYNESLLSDEEDEDDE